jgi:hypothetical protein
MYRWSVSFVLLGVLLGGCTRARPAPSAAEPDTTWTIQFREWGDSQKVRYIYSASGTTTTTVTAYGRTQENPVAEGFHYDFVEEVLQRAAGKKSITRARRTYARAEVIDRGVTRPEVFQGRNVLISRERGRYVFRLQDGGEVTGRDAIHLVESYNDIPPYRRQETVPSQPVKLGEEWKIPNEVARRMFKYPGGMKIDEGRSTGTGRLTRVYEKGGRRFGTIRYRWEVRIADANGAFGAGVQVKSGGGFLGETTVDTCIDGSDSSAELTMSFTGEFALKSPPGSPDVRIRHKGRGKMSSRPAQ